MPGCDGSESTRSCKICNGSGFKVAIVRDLNGRLKPAAIVCLGKKNEKAEGYYPRLSCYRSVTEEDLTYFNTVAVLENRVFHGDVDTFYFCFKTFLVKNYRMDNLTSLIITTSDMMGAYTSKKEEITKVSQEYVVPDLLLVEMGFGDGRESFKRALRELLILRARENKKTWIFYRENYQSAPETSVELDQVLKESNYIIMKKPLPKRNVRKGGF
jgi:hypothetical protein